MLGEVLTALNIIKAVIDIWDRVKPRPTADSARELGRRLEAGDSEQDAPGLIHSLKDQAQQELEPEVAEELLTDVKMRWVLETLKHDLQRQRGWKAVEQPEFLLVLEKLTSLGQLSTGCYLLGCVAGPKSAQAADREFERWTQWLSAQSGQPNGLLLYAYENLAGVSAGHLTGKHQRKLWKYEALGGYLDLSSMNFDLHRGAIENYNKAYGGMSFWEAEMQDALSGIRQEYLRISGFFG